MNATSSKENTVRVNDKPSVQVREISPSSSAEKLVEEGAAFERGKFQNSFQYLCTCVSYAIGFSNLWRFPYLCYKNGGGAFLIPYILSLFIAGMPMMYLEMAIGQFSSQGQKGSYKVKPSCFESILLSYQSDDLSF